MSTSFYHSAEIRWFWPGSDGLIELLTWFTHPGRPELRTPSLPEYQIEPFVMAERPRTDHYLLLPGCETVGIKQRQGRLEVKALVDGPHPFAVDAVSGQMDTWVKWSWLPSTAVAEPLAADLEQSGPWQPVTKTRYTQRLALKGDDLVPVSPTTLPDSGCSVELTWLQVPRHPAIWLTLGFEAFGPAGELPTLLTGTVEQFFNRHGRPPRPLVTADSKSYPAWLAALPESRSG